MSGAQKAAFQERFQAASFTDADAAAAYATYDGEMVSLEGRRGMPDLFVVKFVSMKKQAPLLILNRTVATALKHLLDQEGF
jgi:hypothetical protein